MSVIRKEQNGFFKQKFENFSIGETVYIVHRENPWEFIKTEVVIVHDDDEESCVFPFTAKKPGNCFYKPGIHNYSFWVKIPDPKETWAKIKKAVEHQNREIIFELLELV